MLVTTTYMIIATAGGNRRDTVSAGPCAVEFREGEESGGFRGANEDYGSGGTMVLQTVDEKLSENGLVFRQ